MNQNKNKLSPFVSIVMPSLNQSQFLELAVRSVLEQDYKNIELVVVDGYSVDGSIDLLLKLQLDYGERLKWVSRQDSGAAEAINHAISLTNGELIGWLNSDDLYLQGAVSRAVAYFDKCPEYQMVYGKGSHIDAIGLDLGLYPTKPPSSPLRAFSDGNFICQPTVFMRRNAILEIGFLDTSISTAFDFDLFVRFFKRFPGLIGIVDELQAFSRLHSACITQRMRRQVALDGMRVVSKELGVVPSHWFWTYVEEIFSKYPFDGEQEQLLMRIQNFLKEAKAYLTSDTLKDICKKIELDQRFRLATPELFATVQPDGWVENQVAVKYRWEGACAPALLVKCEAAWPTKGKLHLKILSSIGDIQNITLDVPDDFILRLEVPHFSRSGCMMWNIEVKKGFVPKKYYKNSNDGRELSFRILNLATAS